MMIDHSRELNEWAQKLAAVQLPRWQELPTLALYMDQVVAYINDTLSFLLIDPNPQAQDQKGKKEDRFLTAAMINNYVKHRYIPRPQKKRYQREHLACLMVYALFKQVLPLTDIQKGVAMRLTLCDYDFGKAYDMFCTQVENALAAVAVMAQGERIDAETVVDRSPENLGTRMAALSLASKIVAQKVLSMTGSGKEPGLPLEIASLE